jgi:hypothetical protein
MQRDKKGMKASLKKGTIPAFALGPRKTKFTLEQATKAQSGGRGVALLFP